MICERGKIKGGGWWFFLSRTLLLFFLLIISSPSYGKTTFNNYFTGISGPILENVKKQITTQQEEFEKLTPKAINTYYNEDAPKEIAEALKPFGYFQAKITIKLTQKNDNWNATFDIRPGIPVKITAIDTKISGEGANEKVFKRFIEKNPLKLGSILETEQYKAFKQRFFDLSLGNGYFKSEIEKNTIQINLKKHSARIILYFNTGVHYKIGKISFPKIKLAESFLRRFLTFKEGDFYSAKKILETQENLNNSNYFNLTTVTPDTKLLTSNTVPVEVNLVPRKSKQYDFGVGFGTDTGIRGILGMELRYLTKTGHNLKTFIKASRVQSDAEVHYLMPGKNPATDQYDLSGAFETINQSYGKSTAFKIAAGYTTHAFKNWQQTWRISLQKENYNINYQDEIVLKGNSFLLIPSYSLLYSTSDNPMQPTRGKKINFIIQGAIKNALANATFFQTKIDGKYIFPLTSFHALILRGILGYTSINDLSNLPLSLQYFVGGTQTVRGYGYNKLGPGRDLMVGSIELRQKIVPSWYITAFLVLLFN